MIPECYEEGDGHANVRKEEEFIGFLADVPSGDSEDDGHDGSSLNVSAMDSKLLDSVKHLRCLRSRSIPPSKTLYTRLDNSQS